MNGFYIQISNGLITDRHRKRMGSAVWEFMWLLDKITKIDDYGNGYVLGGKAINLEDISKDLGTHSSSVSENLSKLEKEDYIERTHTPYGISIKLKKAKKRFGQKTKPSSEKTKGDSEKTKPTIYKTLDITIDLPDWLNKEVWGEWVDYRKERGKRLTPMSIKKQLKELENNKSDHVKIINNSIKNSWTGLFPLKNQLKISFDRKKYLDKRAEGINDLEEREQNSRDNDKIRELHNQSKEIAKNFKNI